MQPSGAELGRRFTVEQWVLSVLMERGERSLDELGQSLPEMNWAQLFLAIDKLSRSGKICLRRAKDGDYIVGLSASGKIAV
jgi:hypothetical protein